MSRNGKRQAIQNVWNNFTGNFSKKLKIEEEEKEPHFRFGKEQVVKNQSDTIQSPSKVSKHWERNDSTKSLDLSNQNSCIPRFVNRSSSIGGFYHNNQFIASKEAVSSSFNNLRRASTTDWGKLVENAFLDQILDDIKVVESEREVNKNLWTWEDDFNQFTSL